jgi:hypothetical protein
MGSGRSPGSALRSSCAFTQLCPPICHSQKIGTGTMVWRQAGSDRIGFRAAESSLRLPGRLRASQRVDAARVERPTEALTQPSEAVTITLGLDGLPDDASAVCVWSEALLT